MRFVRFVCLFVILISLLMLAQSNRAPLVNQPNRQPTAQQPQQEVHPNLSQMPHVARFGQHGGRAFKEPSTRRGSSSSGLNFAPAVTYGSGGDQTFSVAVADVNGDGKPDLLVANVGNGVGVVGVLLGNGDGTFQAPVSYGSGGQFAVSVAVADVNADGKPDLLVANQCFSNTNCSNGSVGVLLGNGDGTFQTAVPYGSGGYSAMSIAVADVNGDGKPDLLVANCTASSSNCSQNYGEVGILLGNGDGTFQTAVVYGSGGFQAYSIAVVDINGDDNPDIVIANHCDVSGNCMNGLVSVLLGNGDGSFQTAVSYGSGGLWAEGIAVADVNGDSKPDVVVVDLCVDLSNCNSGVVGVLLGNGDGTFKTVATYGSGGANPNSVGVADLDGDGKPDIAVVNGYGDNFEGYVGVLLGKGDGSFQTAVTYDSGAQLARSVVAADVNGDGRPDLAVGTCSGDGQNCSSGSVGVLINSSISVTTTTLASSPNPSNLGQLVTFTATVTTQGFYKGPTGTVSFFDGKTNIGNSNLNSNGVATLTISTLTVGTHSITAVYNGATNFLPSTSPVLYQVVQAAIVVLTPTSLNFGNQTVGITSSPQIVMLRNTGNIDLTIKSIRMTGMNRGNFAESNNCPDSVPPNDGCQINVTFTPTATGTRNAAVKITDNAPGSPQSIPLTGVGVLPAVTFSPTSLTFPTQLVFTTGTAQPVRLTNSGLGTLLISKIAVSGPFRQTNNCPNSVGPGASCTIRVEKFRPKTKGVQNGTISVTDNAPGSPQTVPLKGIGTFVQLVPTKLNFGSQPVGTRSLAKKITLTNKGSVTVNISGIAITGTDAGDFAETNTCGKSVASGASCFIKVTFKPLVKGQRTAEVSVYDNGGGSPQQANLIGTGT